MQKCTKNQPIWALHGSMAGKKEKKKKRKPEQQMQLSVHNESVIDFHTVPTKCWQTDYRKGFCAHPVVWSAILWMIKIPMAVSVTDSSFCSGNLSTENDSVLMILKHIFLIQLVLFHRCLSKLFRKQIYLCRKKEKKTDWNV